MSTLARGTNRHAGVHGVVRLEPDALVLDYRAEVWQSSPLSGVVRVPLDEIAAIRWHWRGLLRRSGKIELVVRRLGVLDDFPFVGGARCVLPILRQDTSAARELVATAADRIADRALRRELRALPPPEMPGSAAS